MLSRRCLTRDCRTLIASSSVSASILSISRFLSAVLTIRNVESRSESLLFIAAFKSSLIRSKKVIIVLLDGAYRTYGAHRTSYEPHMSYKPHPGHCASVIGRARAAVNAGRWIQALRGLAKFVCLCNSKIRCEIHMKRTKERPCGGIGRRLRLRTEGPLRA